MWGKEMKFLKYMLPLCAAVSFSSLCAQDLERSDGVSTTTEARQRDDDALRDYINTKRAISVKEKGGNLMLSGDIRGEWDHMHAKTNHKDQRGCNSRKLFPNSLGNTQKEDKQIYHEDKKKAKEAYDTEIKKKPSDKEKRALKRQYHKKLQKAKYDYRSRRDKFNPPFAKNEFSIEANMMMDYRAERGWGSIQLRFDNPAGTSGVKRENSISDNRNIMWGSGIRNNITLRRAYAGYNVWEQGTSRFDIEIGRRKMYDLFDSRIEFDSYFDGIVARCTTSFEGWADLAFKAGAFVIDSKANHYGYVGEADFMNLLDSGVDFKYSLIDWQKRGKNRFGKHNPVGSKFLNSQFLLAYNVPPDFFNMKTQFYGAYLVNSLAKPNRFTHHERANEAFYVGMQMGEVKRKGDWSWSILYQWVEAQAIPEGDVQDQGRDNPREISLYNRASGGFGNYKGWVLEGLYAVTDNWTIRPMIEQEHALSKKIGGPQKSSQFTLETIFAF